MHNFNFNFNSVKAALSKRKTNHKPKAKLSSKTLTAANRVHQDSNVNANSTLDASKEVAECGVSVGVEGVVPVVVYVCRADYALLPKANLALIPVNSLKNSQEPSENSAYNTKKDSPSTKETANNPKKWPLKKDKQTAKTNKTNKWSVL